MAARWINYWSPESIGQANQKARSLTGFFVVDQDIFLSDDRHSKVQLNSIRRHDAYNQDHRPRSAQSGMARLA